MKSQPTVTSTFASRTSPSTDQSLQKSLQLSNPDKIELKKISSPSKNKKYPTHSRHSMTRKLNNDNGLQGLTERRPAYNRRLAKKRVQCLNEALCFVSSSVLADSLVLRNPLLRQAPKR